MKIYLLISLFFFCNLFCDTFNLDSAVQDAKAMQDQSTGPLPRLRAWPQGQSPLESLLVGAEHSQKVKAAQTKSDYGSRGCVDLASSTAESRFNEVKSSIDKLPYLQQSIITQDVNHYAYHPENMYEAVKEAHLLGLDFDAIYQIERKFFAALENSSFSDQGHFLNRQAAPDGYFDADQMTKRTHYVQKLIVPAGTRVLLHGDLHGDAHSLVASLAPYMKEDDGFRLKDDLYVVFLGDYVDKGLYGLECIYILLRLKIDNPDRVFLVRGNHEDSGICNYYGFQDELTQKGFSKEQIEILYRLYDIMPVALYLGCNNNYVQLCHGGLELGYIPTALLNAECSIEYEWITELNRFSIYSQLSAESRAEMAPFIQIYPHACKDHTIPLANSTMDALVENEKRVLQLGFLWTDFTVSPEATMSYKPHRGFVYNKRVTHELLDLTNSGLSKLCGIIRGHQHKPDADDPLMRLMLNLDGRDKENKGVAKLWTRDIKTGTHVWQDIVVTFLLSPDTLFGPPDGSWPGFDYDTTGTLTPQEQFSDWTLSIKRTHLPYQ